MIFINIYLIKNMIKCMKKFSLILETDFRKKTVVFSWKLLQRHIF